GRVEGEGVAPSRQGEARGAEWRIHHTTRPRAGPSEPVIQDEPPPTSQALLFCGQVSLPFSPRAGMVYRRHRWLPVSVSQPSMKPRMPNSAPEMPVTNTPFTTSGATVSEKPSRHSAPFDFHRSLPCMASYAITWASSVVRKTLPL